MGRSDGASTQGTAAPGASASPPATVSGTGPSPGESPAAATVQVTPPRAAARSRWARLLARIFEVLPLLCPRCGAEMRIVAFLTDPEPVRAILHHLDLPATPPPLSPARGPPQHGPHLDVEHAEHALDLDQTPAFDPAEPEPVPDFD